MRADRHPGHLPCRFEVLFDRLIEAGVLVSPRRSRGSNVVLSDEIRCMHDLDDDILQSIASEARQGMGLSDHRHPDQAARTGIEAAMGKTRKAS